MLSREAKNWIPYESGQIIIFKSNKGNTDSLKILSVNSYINPEDPLAVSSRKHETITIDAKVPNRWTNPMGTSFRYSEQTILELNANKRNATCKVSFKPNKHYFKSAESDISQISYVTKVIGARSFDEVTTFACNSGVFCEKDNSIDSILWSKQYGIVQYRLGDETFNYLKRLSN